MPHLLIYSRPFFVLKLPMLVITMEKHRIYVISFYTLLESSFIIENVLWERQRACAIIYFYFWWGKKEFQNRLCQNWTVWMTANYLLAAWYWGKLSLGLKFSTPQVLSAVKWNQPSSGGLSRAPWGGVCRRSSSVPTSHNTQWKVSCGEVQGRVTRAGLRPGPQKGLFARSAFVWYPGTCLVNSSWQWQRSSVFLRGMWNFGLYEAEGTYVTSFQ